MYLSHLSLAHFRNYRQSELDFAGPLTLLQGQNAQGKTNLLEAIYFLATSKPVHAGAEREIVNWRADEEPIPYCRVAATVRTDEQSADRPLELEIILTPRGDGVNFNKQVKINGVGKRNVDLVGQMRAAVLFLPEDIQLIAGSPGQRRRYLDIALCQIDRSYTSALSQFQKIVTRRNSLLKSLREEGAPAQNSGVDAQLSFWDESLVQHGSLVVAQRYTFIRRLEQIARERHAELSGTREELSLQYVPSFNPGYLSETEYARLKAEPLPQARTAEFPPMLAPETVAHHLHAKLQSRRARELTVGSTLYGPHRDDLRLLANGRDLRTYGSRGQQRTAALSLKLAEVRLMAELTGAMPLLLLDDVMSELDAQRRSMLLTVLDSVEQAILTTTDWDDFTPEFRTRAQLWQVRNGQIEPVENPATGARPGSVNGAPNRAPDVSTVQHE